MVQRSKSKHCNTLRGSITFLDDDKQQNKKVRVFAAVVVICVAMVHVWVTDAPGGVLAHVFLFAHQLRQPFT